MATEDGVEFNPPRISYHEGIVLDVVLNNDTPRHSISSASESVNTIPLLSESEPNSNLAAPLPTRGPGTPIRLLLDDEYKEYKQDPSAKYSRFADLSSRDPSSGRNSPSIKSSDVSSKVQTSYQAHYDLYRSYFEAVRSSQDDRSRLADIAEKAASIKNEMIEQFSHLSDKMDNNATNIFEILERIYRMQEEMERNQRRMLDQLNTIQSRIQTVLTQNYELHEYPIPRLFVVLPKPRKGLRRNFFSYQFQLFFLCECGEHTMHSKSATKHEVHLAKHEGYDLERPAEFFEKYGDYIMTMMQMVKFGCTAAGVFVPAIENLNLIKGLEDFLKKFDLSRNAFSSLVDETINFLQDTQKRTGHSIEPSDNRSPFDRFEVLEGADLRQLDSYLRIKDEGRVLGNLYRIVTETGNVKWVCVDHYRDNYRIKDKKLLASSIASMGGTFEEQIGAVTIEVDSPSQAKNIYSVLVKARGIQELDIKLNWDATMDDIRTFASCISEANIRNITLDGRNFDGPTMDIYRRRHRFEPIVQLMSTGRIQSLRLMNFVRFFDRVTTLNLKVATQLRVLSLGIVNIEKEEASKSVLTTMLDNCSNLQILELTTLEEPQYLTKFAMEKYGDHFRLEAADAKVQDHTITVTLDFLLMYTNTRAVTYPLYAPHHAGPKVLSTTHYNLKVKITSSDRTVDSRQKLLSVYSKCGWAIKELDSSWRFDDRLANTLDKATTSLGSMLTTLSLDVWNLSHEGLKCMQQVVRRSNSLKRLVVEFSFLSDSVQQDKLGFMDETIIEKLTSISLKGNSPDSWMPSAAKVIPFRQLVPRLESFKIESWAPITKGFYKWVAAMVSIPSHAGARPLGFSHLRQNFSSAGMYESPNEITETCSPLKRFSLEGAKLEPAEWETIIKALDFSSLEELSFRGSNFSLNDLDILINCISPDNDEMPLRLLNLEGTEADNDAAVDILVSQVERLRKRAQDLANIELTEW
ncbi:hypothetical protein BGX21_005529 [Mortierella sp. AD011]|nr:hypothetical protein BGX20_005885 [Mortierella sp. AD010]KAF9399845.1 hypothetical protein BGX21_005529 [Mortierella sp. AD011]